MLHLTLEERLALTANALRKVLQDPTLALDSRARMAWLLSQCESKCWDRKAYNAYQRDLMRKRRA